MNAPIFTSGFKTWFRVRGGIYGPALFLVIMFIIEGSFWKTLSSKTSQVSHYSASQILFYAFCALILSQVTACTGEPDSLSEKIETGSLDQFLLKPKSYISYMISLQLGICAARMLLLLPVCIFFQWYFLGTNHFSVILPFIVMMPLAATLNFLINHLLSSLTFFYRDSYAFVQFKETLFAVLTGTLIPIDLFPDSIAKILYWFPSSYLVYFPTKVLLGEVSAVFVLKFQVMFLLILLGLSAFWWRVGIKKYQAYGG